MPKDSRCSRRTRVLRALEHARRKRLTKAERKKGRREVVKEAIAEANAEPDIFVSKAKFDQQRQDARKSLREMADEMYRRDYG